MKKSIALLTVLFFAIYSISSTPDRNRVVLDSLIGYIGEDIIILQYVYDNYGSHYDEIEELYILKKTVVDGKLALKNQQKIASINVLSEYFNKKDFYYAMPDIVPSSYLVLSNNYKSIEYLGTSYMVDEIIPDELKEFKIDHIECIYTNKEYVFVVLVLENMKKSESMRKIFLLTERMEK